MTRHGIHSANRRAFVRASISGLATLAFPRVSFAFPEPTDDRIFTLGLIADPATSGPLYDTARGAAFGILEARHTAALFGKQIREVRTTYPTSVGDSSEAAAGVIVFAGAASGAAAAAEAAAKNRIVLINASASDDALRREICSDFLFHVAASDAMYQAAGSSSSTAGAPDASVGMWSGTLRRFGAEQLNDRFRSAQLPANSNTWAGWMAVKIAWEAFLRATPRSGEGIASYLSRESTQFDGHKGAPLSFRSWDHQLRQPLYAAAIEIPDLAGSSTPVREVLDTIGDRKGDGQCRR